MMRNYKVNNKNSKSNMSNKNHNNNSRILQLNHNKMNHQIVYPPCQNKIVMTMIDCIN